MKVAKFALVGGIGFIIDGALFYLLVKAELDIISARLIAFWLTASFTWLGNKYLTFNCSLKNNLLKQWGKHMVSSHCSGAVNLVTFYFISLTGALELAFTVGVLLGAISNYWLSDKFVFRQQAEIEIARKAA